MKNNINILTDTELFEVYNQFVKILESVTILLGYEDELNINLHKDKINIEKQILLVEDLLTNRNICLNCGNKLTILSKDDSICEFCK